MEFEQLRVGMRFNIDQCFEPGVSHLIITDVDHSRRWFKYRGVKRDGGTYEGDRGANTFAQWIYEGRIHYNGVLAKNNNSMRETCFKCGMKVVKQKCPKCFI